MLSRPKTSQEICKVSINPQLLEVIAYCTFSNTIGARREGLVKLTWAPITAHTMRFLSSRPILPSIMVNKKVLTRTNGKTNRG